MGRARLPPAVPRRGGGWADLQLAVDGLALGEVFYDAVGVDDAMEWIELANTGSVPIDLSHYSLGAGRTSYTYTKAQLSGTLPAGGCAVIGGPASSPANGAPLYALELNFSPDLPNGGDDASGIAIFDLHASELDAATLPLDA